MKEFENLLRQVKLMAEAEGANYSETEAQTLNYIGEHQKGDDSGDFEDYPIQAKRLFVEDMIRLLIALEKLNEEGLDIFEERKRFGRVYRTLKIIAVSSINLTDIVNPSLPKLDIDEEFSIVTSDRGHYKIF